MKSRNTVLRVRRLNLALSCALASLATAAMAPAALADDVTALTKPTNTVDVGALVTDKSSPLFGEYNGLNDSGTYLLGGFNLRGGDAWGEGLGNRTWSLTGSNLGTTSRSLSGAVADQGSWSLGLSYDELRNYDGNSTTNSPATYQTPLQGSMGGNTFTLPAGFGAVNAATTCGGTLKGTQCLTPTQQGFFHTVGLYTERDTTRFNAAHQFGQDWSLTFDWTNIKQSGAVLTGAATDANTLSSTSTAAPAKEDPMFIPNPTNYNTDNFNLALNWAGDKGFFTGAFYSSKFTDNYGSVWYATPYATATMGGSLDHGNYPMDVLSTFPTNLDNEVRFSGGYRFTPATQLVGGYSYGRNTQNMSYLGNYEPAMLPGGLPVTSLDGVVITQHANWRVTNQTTRDLSLSAGMTYSKRDNQTPSNVYNFITPSNDSLYAVNTPLSYSILTTDVAGDYHIDQNRRLHVGLENQHTQRWCDNQGQIDGLVNGVATTGAVIGQNGVQYSRSGCAEVPEESQNKLTADYRAKATDTVSYNAGLTYADRRSTVNPSFYNPIQSAEPQEGQGLENPGYMAYFDASRHEESVKGGINWQATPRLTMSVDGTFANDQYIDSTLGVQSGHMENVNLESDFAVSEQASFGAYLSWQLQSRNLLSEAGSLGKTGSSAPGTEYDWANSLRDQAATLGFTAKRSGLMGDRLALKADLSYSRDVSTYSTNVVPGSGPTAASTIATCGNVVSASGNLTCGSIPNVANELLRLNLAGTYRLDQKNTFVVGYIYEQLHSNDYIYNSVLMGFTPTSVLPTNETNPTFTQNVVYVEYQYAFQ